MLTWFTVHCTDNHVRFYHVNIFLLICLLLTLQILQGKCPYNFHTMTCQASVCIRGGVANNANFWGSHNAKIAKNEKYKNFNNKSLYKHILNTTLLHLNSYP